MRFVVLLSLLFAAPVSAQVSPSLWEKTLTLCKIDYTEYQKGNKTWLEDKVKTLREEDQVAVLSMCYAWGRGLIDGVKIERGNARRA